MIHLFCTAASTAVYCTIYYAIIIPELLNLQRLIPNYTFIVCSRK